MPRKEIRTLTVSRLQRRRRYKMFEWNGNAGHAWQRDGTFRADEFAILDSDDRGNPVALRRRCHSVCFSKADYAGLRRGSPHFLRCLSPDRWTEMALVFRDADDRSRHVSVRRGAELSESSAVLLLA